VSEQKKSGTLRDGTLVALKRYGIPVTRENYLLLAFAGKVPDPLPWEVEEALPEEIRKK
jgi:hypothetical protein